MASDNNDFGLSGPLHLTIDYWKNAHYRRSVVASLVQGVYVLERDRQEKRHGQNALAPPWWELFNFRLIQELVDPNDQSFFGCIYELKIPNPSHTCLTQNHPKYVVAFRGTINKPDTRFEDFKLDLQCMVNRLQRCPRFKLGLKSVKSKVEVGSIWLAGHSLGSAIALMVGRNMLKLGYRLETYLFNPPFPSVPLEKISEKLKDLACFVTSIITAGLAAAVKLKTLKPKQDDEFRALSEWVPYLFVNPSDPICSEYIRYFAYRDKMMAILGEKIGMLAAQNSIASILQTFRGKDCDAYHLIPCANVTTNLSPSKNFTHDHGIHQWWRPDLHLDNKQHEFKRNHKKK